MADAARGADTPHGTRQFSAVTLVLALVIGILAVLAGPTARSKAAGTCSDPNGYLFQYSAGPTQIDKIDMVTGQQQTNIGEIFGREINAVGFNPIDNKFYGWDNQNGTLVSVTDDLATTTALTITGYTGPTTGDIIGDVDDQGHYWLLNGNTWYEIDVSGSTPTQIASGTPSSNPTGSSGADWAFVPGTDSLWRTMDNGTNVSVWTFSRTNHDWHNVATATNMTTSGDRVIGANYADPYNHLFIGSNSTGNLWEVDLTGLSTTASSPVGVTATLIGTGNPSSTNDGARCSLAPIPTDFGDAPSSYKTLLADDGPRHNVIGYDAVDHTAPLMLGRTIDIEPDGYPTTAANGDDTHGVNDEDAVGSITVGGKTSLAVAVPVTVTNNANTTATLAGWIDSNNNGMFDTGERVMLVVPASSGTKTYTLTFPTAHYTSDTYLRLRIFSGSVSDPQPTGPATGGEVEDHFISVDPDASGVIIGPTPGAPNTGYGVFRHKLWPTILAFGLTAAVLFGGALLARKRIA